VATVSAVEPLDLFVRLVLAKLSMENELLRWIGKARLRLESGSASEKYV
jgi:hypothetical protein